MDDIRLWRVAINSYPYQSVETMGVYDKYDAYVATKQAIYCVLYDFDPNTRFKGGDERGEAIKNAIVKLVNIARNGTQTPFNSDAIVNKSGELFEDGEYYSQKYTVNAPVDISQYTITNVAGLPSGGIITDLNNNQKTTFSGSETFKVKIPKSKLSDDINVIINVSAKAKTYPVFYGKSRIPDTQDYLVTYDPYGDTVGRANLNVKTNTAKIKINKTDDETGKAIEGVTFELKELDGTVIGTGITNSNGDVVFSGLYQKTYKLSELSTNLDYILNDEIIEVNTEFNKTTIVNITNEHKKGNLKVYKVDKDNNRIALGNVSFDLFSEEFQKVIGTYISSVDGEIFIENIRTGFYQLIEKNTGKWYNLAEDTEVKVEWNKTKEYTVENELKKSQVRVVKVDKDNPEIKLQDVVIHVLDENERLLEILTTDENGEALTSEYAIRDFEKLKFREVRTNEYYKLNDEMIEVELVGNEIVELIIENEQKKGQIKVVKIDKDAGVRIENVTFEVYDENENLVEILVSDANGEAISSQLPISKPYTIKETITQEIYVLSDEIQTVTLKEDQITEVTFENEKRKGQIKVIKTDGETQYPIEGVVFEIVNSQEEILDEIITDHNGEATSKRIPIDEVCYVREKSTLSAYILSDEVCEVELTENEITTVAFENYKKRGNIRIIKTSSDDIVEGFTFKVSGVTLCGDYYEEEYVTDKSGEIYIENIPVGILTISESSNEYNERYVIPEDQDVTVEHDETVEVFFHNEIIEVPDTGDTSMMIIKVILLGISIIGLSLYYIDKFKKSKNKKR